MTGGSSTPPAWRSLLFVPANDNVRCAKVVRSHTDAVILDLEDGVAASQKEVARARIAQVAIDIAAASIAPLVRINSDWRAAMADLDAAVVAGVVALVVPKVDSPLRLQVLSEMIAEFELLRGLPRGQVGLVALVEAPWALAELPAIAAVDRVVGLALGSEDYSLQMGVAPSPSLLEPACRAIAAAASKRAQLAAAVPFSIAAYRDKEGFAKSARAAAGFGINGALCVHPDQVAVANEAFRPSDAECQQARTIVAVWSRAEASESGVIVVDGAMIDRPVVERAQRVLARAR